MPIEYVCKPVQPGIDIFPGRTTLARHCHVEGYATVVLSGSFVESGFLGRVELEPGDVILHGRFDCHTDCSRGTRSVQLLRLPWPTDRLEGHFRVTDPDLIARLAEQDSQEAVVALEESIRVVGARSSHWTHNLALALRNLPPLSLGRWARTLGMRPEALSRGFYREFGVSPKQFRVQARARCAWFEILASSQSLTGIAQDCGFSDLSHMTRSIRSLTGRPPSAWRSLAAGSRTQFRSSYRRANRLASYFARRRGWWTPEGAGMQPLHASKIHTEITRMRVPTTFFVVFALLFSAFARADKDCHLGSYRLSDGSAIDIAPSFENTLRWRLFDGETGQLHPAQNGTWSSTYGWTGRADGKSVAFSPCEKGEIHFDKESGQRIDFDVLDTSFQSEGTKLIGRLILPKGAAKVPVVVLVHGSEHDSAIDSYALQRMFPAQGIGAFVYDKRGTGASAGTYTQDFKVLAADAIAALNEAKRLAGGRLGRIGYQGGSEGGWVVPLAVNRMPVDFAIVSFGLAVTVLEEDQESVALDMALHHHSAADTAKALKLARAGEHVVETVGEDGYEAFDALRQKFKSEPWYQDVHGDFVFFIMPMNKQQIIDAVTKEFNARTTPFRYQPMPTLRASTTAQLWVLGGDDLDAPSAETSVRIKSLIASGKDFTLAVYPGAEHGMTEYELDAKGERVSTRFSPGYFQMMADFIREGRIGESYGKAEITRPARKL